MNASQLAQRVYVFGVPVKGVGFRIALGSETFGAVKKAMAFKCKKKKEKEKKKGGFESILNTNRGYCKTKGKPTH
jgi:hypothetical protein